MSDRGGDVQNSGDGGLPYRGYLERPAERDALPGRVRMIRMRAFKLIPGRWAEQRDSLESRPTAM